MKWIEKLEKRVQTIKVPQLDGTMAEVSVGSNYYDLEDVGDKINELITAFNSLNKTTKKVVIKDKKKVQNKPSKTEGHVYVYSKSRKWKRV